MRIVVIECVGSHRSVVTETRVNDYYGNDQLTHLIRGGDHYSGVTSVSADEDKWQNARRTFKTAKLDSFIPSSVPVDNDFAILSDESDCEDIETDL